MQKHYEMSRNRLKSFLGQGQMRGRVYPSKAAVNLAIFDAPGRISHAAAMLGNYAPTSVGRILGSQWATHWLRVEIRIPADWAVH